MEKQFLFVDVANPTWLVYLSVLVLAVFFRFSRLFTVRNLDLLLILVLSASLVITGEWKGKPVEDLSTPETEMLTKSPDGQQPVLSGSGVFEDAFETQVAFGTAVAVPTALTKRDVNSGTDFPPQQLAKSPGAVTPSLSSESELRRDGGSAAPPAEALTVSSVQLPPLDAAAPMTPPGLAETAGLAVPAQLPVAVDATGTQPVALSDLRSPVVQGADALTAASSGPQFHPVYRWGSVTLLVLSLLLMVRLVFDESLTRRPRLEQNLNQAGLAFLCIPCFAVLTVSVFVVEPPNSAMAAVEHGRALLQRRETKVSHEPVEAQPPAPTETLIAAGAAGVAQLSGQWESEDIGGASREIDLEKSVAQILVVIAHTVVVLGLLHIGRQHFGSLQLGLSMSCLYLLLPCTAFNVHQLSHVLPGACLTWAIASYRKPVVSGILLGLACGTLFFSVFLLPVWAVFYGRRGALRFGLSVFSVAAILAVCLMLTSSDADSFVSKLFTTMNWTVYRLLDETGSTPETPFGQLFVRIPLAAVFFVMLTAMTVLPRPRNLENLLANSTALVVAAQLWYPEDIGTYVLWYLPLLLLVIFRPRLDRFMPPDLSDRATAALSPPLTNGAPSSVAMSRLTLYR